MQHVTMSRFQRTVVAAAPLALVLALLSTASVQAQSATLYERLGGYEAISAVVDDFAAKLFDDEVVGVRFKGMSTDSRNGFRQKNKNLVCNVTGGPCQIISRPAAVAHGGLNITEDEWNIVFNHLVETLQSFNVPEQEKSELLEIVGTLKSDIVGR